MVEKRRVKRDLKEDESIPSWDSFDVSEGELVAVVGPVGCGKSTLLMAVLREITPVNGTITVNGRVIYASQVCSLSVHTV